MVFGVTGQLVAEDSNVEKEQKPDNDRARMVPLELLLIVLG